MKKAFRPEFLNRVDDIIVFAHLNKDEVRKIADIMLNDLIKRIKEQELTMEVTDEVKDYLAKDGYSENYGARPLRRLIQKKIEDPIAEEILTGEYKHGDTIRLKLDNDRIVFERITPEQKAANQENQQEQEVQN